MKKNLRGIGEFGLIRRISQSNRPGPSVIKGIGDDCAVLKYTKQRYLLFTTDMIIEDVHFKRGIANAKEIGHKALAANISDIACCGGIPRWAVISAGLPANSSIDYIMNIYKGIEALARRFKVDIVGGDTNSSEKIIISLALLGEVEKRDLTLRSGARDKDVIALSGPLRADPDSMGFVPRLKKAQYLVKNFKLTSMIDMSDGFLSDLNHILEASGKGATIYESLIPYRGRQGSLGKILDKGEQFELIFTLPGSELKRLPKGFYPVGEIVKRRQGIVCVNRNGRSKKIEPHGYRHF